MTRLLTRLPALCLVALAACGPGSESLDRADDGRLSAATTLGGVGAATDGYARADAVRDFTFPDDHGAHPDFRTEWWYVTGHLDAAQADRSFGFQFTIFRSALRPEPVAPSGSPSEGSAMSRHGFQPVSEDEPAAETEPASAWATRQAYLGHFTLTDLDAPGGGRFDAFERAARGAAGLAGATESEEDPPYRAWIGPWSVEWVEGDHPPGRRPLRLTARQVGDDGRRVEVDLTLEPRKDPVLQGDRGLSAKGPEPGNASYYYSLTRLAARGTVTVGDAVDDADPETLPVTGSAWLDREWSTSALGPDEVGWDWFSLQLDGDRELMLYQIRRRDGSAAPTSEGIWVEPDGTTRPISWDEIELTVTDRWTSPGTGVVYPSGWRLRWPAGDLDLTVTPLLAEQELDLSFLYWEGAVAVTGNAVGRGYVELVGYDRPQP